MGLFKKPVCCICGKEIISAKTKLNSGDYICATCVQKVGISDGFTYDTLKTLSQDEIISRMTVAAENKAIQHQRVEQFRPGLKFGNYIWFDDSNNWFVIPAGNKIVEQTCPVIAYDDILDYEVIEDGDAILQGGLGKALVGGALFGLPGAIAGGSSKHSKATCTLLQLKITTKSEDVPVQYVVFNNTELKKSGAIYKGLFRQLQEIVAKLKQIVDNAAAPPQMEGVASAADEILKFKSLLDAGAITQEEYDAKKAQLLGL